MILLLVLGCRETSFIYAITSAGLTHAMAYACANGTVNGCNCKTRMPHPQRLNENKWRYQRCHDNIKYGYTFSRRFTNRNEPGRDFRAIINLHNNEAGRLVSIRYFFIFLDYREVALFLSWSKTQPIYSFLLPRAFLMIHICLWLI